MIKKIIKNILLLFIIIYTILSLFMYVYNTVNAHIFSTTMANRIKYNDFQGIISDEETIDRIKSNYGEEIPAFAIGSAQSYIVGVHNILEKETTIILIASILSIVIGVIITLTEKSKIKEILYFLLIGIVINLIYTIYFHLTRNLPETDFFEGFIDNFIYNIQYYGIYYIIIYIIAYICKYFVNKKSIDKLNKELKNKKEKHI